MHFSRLNMDGVVRDCLSGRQAYRLKYGYDSEIYFIHGRRCLDESVRFSYRCFFGKMMVIIGFRLLGKNTINFTITRDSALLGSNK